MAETHDISCEATVRISVADNAPADWLTRVGDDNFPYRNIDRTPFTPDRGKEHLAFNALSNGVNDASRLDGWADLERGMVTMDVTDVDAL